MLDLEFRGHFYVLGNVSVDEGNEALLVKGIGESTVAVFNATFLLAPELEIHVTAHDSLWCTHKWLCIDKSSRTGGTERQGRLGISASFLRYIL